MDNNPYATAQLRAERVAETFGMQAPRPLSGETPMDYRMRLLDPYREHSPAWKAANLRVLSKDEKTFAIAEAQIYQDAYHAGTHPSNAPGSPLRSVTKRLASGHTETRFYGDPAEAWKPFMGAGVRYLIGINRHPAGARDGS